MSKLIGCKSCEKEISKEAKVCPHCGAKQKMALWKKLIIGLFVLAFIGAVFGPDDDNRGVIVAGGNQSVDNGPSIISIDEKIAYGDISTSISSLELKKTLSDEMGVFTAKAQDGATLVAVIIDQTNVSNKPVSAFSVPQLTLISPDGIEYEADLGKTSEYSMIKEVDEKILSDIAPGLRSESAFVFEVSDQQLSKTGWTLKVGDITNVMFKVN